MSTADNTAAAVEVASLQRLVRWLAIPYGTNMPGFHGEHKGELQDAYLAALRVSDPDLALEVARSWVIARPEPSPDVDLGDQYVEMVRLDEHGNTVQ